MTTFPNGSTSIIFCPYRSGKRSIEIKLSQDYINMCNMENKHNTKSHRKLHKKGKIKNFQKNKNLRKYHYIHQPGRTNCSQRYQK